MIEHLSRPTVKWAMRLGVAGGLLYLLFRFVPFRDVVGLMARADAVWVGAAFGILVVERLCAAWRMKLLTDQLGMPLSVLKIAEIGVSATFYTTFLPGDLAGGAVRWYRMARPEGQRAQAFAALVFERLIDTIVLVSFGLVFWLWDSPPYETALFNAVLVALLGGLLLAMVVALSPRTSILLERVITLVPWSGLRHTLSEKVEKVLVAVRTYRTLRVRPLIGVIVLSVLRHVLSILMLICFVNALSMSVAFVTLAWIRSVQNILTMLPVAFAGLGVREASMVVLLEPYGVAASAAVALSLFTFLVHLSVAAVGGLLELKNTFVPGTPAAGRSAK